MCELWYGKIEILSKNIYWIDMDVASSYTYVLASSVAELSPAWDDFCDNEVFFCRDWLSVVDDDALASVQQYYVQIFDGDDLVGGIIMQVKQFRLSDSLRDLPKPKGLLQNVSQSIKKILARAVNYQVVVAGNLLLTGQYGVRVPASVDEATVEQALTAGANQLRARGVKLSGIIRKDYEAKDRLPTSFRYAEFTVQPTMYLAVRQNWIDLETYMADMKSKYRVRIRKALKLITPVEKRILTLEEISEFQSDIHRLYSSISEAAGFNMFYLPADYFYQLKSRLGVRVDIIGYFLEGEMVGFYSAIENGRHLDAHFLGYDPQFNKQLQLYLNMLIGLTSLAIDRKYEGIQMSRTAMEIKSSVGAVPTDYYVYLRAYRGWINRLLPPILNYFVPKEHWEQRHPFK